jgi:hypothetical protein
MTAIVLDPVFEAPSVHPQPWAEQRDAASKTLGCDDTDILRFTPSLRF